MSSRDVSDVLPGRDRPRDLDPTRGLRREFRGHHGIEPCGIGAPVMMRMAARAAIVAVERLAGQRPGPRTGKLERVVLARARRSRRRAARSRPSRRGRSPARRAARRRPPRGSGRQRLRAARSRRPGATRVPSIHSSDGGDFAAPAEAVHAHVGYGRHVAFASGDPESVSGAAKGTLTRRYILLYITAWFRSSTENIVRASLPTLRPDPRPFVHRLASVLR